MIEKSEYMTEKDVDVLSKSMNHQLDDLCNDLKNHDIKKLKHIDVTIMMEVMENGDEWTQ